DSISNPNDVDLFKFTVSAGQKLSFDIDIPGGSALYSYIEIINSAGQYITYNAAGTAPGETYDPHQSYLEYTFTTGGTYYVAVACSANENFNLLTGGSDHAGVSGTSGAYSLTIRNL
ncbi:MAG TPA: PPC domain-containing protein, partial [Humisphaera sp.]|nr:PPC domain-containing protein [Humisphaera sp.]